jgi:hypothetical protein
MSLAHGAQTALWLRQLLKDLGFEQKNATVIFEDNQSCIAIVKNPVQPKRTKHIDIKYHFVRELVANNTLSIQYIKTDEQLADILTKGLSREQHVKLCNMIGLLRTQC